MTPHSIEYAKRLLGVKQYISGWGRIIISYNYKMSAPPNDTYKHVD